MAEVVCPELVERLRAGEVVVRDRPAGSSRGREVPAVRHALIAPLRLGSQLVGLLALDHGDSPHRYTPDERLLASAVAQLATIVIERDRLVREREGARASEYASREATRRMELFMGMAGHEFRTPLTVIRGYLTLATRHLAAVPPPGEGDAQGAKALHSVAESLEQASNAALGLTGLLDDLLQVSRAQAGKLPMRPRPCDLLEVMRAKVEEQGQVNPDRQVTLRLPAGAHAPVFADPDRIGQVVSNYLTNAFKYSPEDQPVDVEVALQAGVAKVSVRDAGPGMAVADQEHIWERFYQVAGVQRRPGSDPGLGLGLYVCRMIVEQHDGQVGVDSSVGSGSTFWFTLPLVSAAQV
jgi:signal transduction histidine kinase